MELRHCVIGLASCFHEQGIPLLELFHFSRSIGKCLGHADSRDTALKSRVDHRDALAALHERITHLLAHNQRYNNQNRHAGKDDQGENPVDGAQVCEGAHNHDSTDKKVLWAVMRKLGYVHQVVGHTGHDLAGLVIIVVGVGKSL